MNKGLLIAFVVYYTLMALLFVLGQDVLNNFDNNINLNTTAVSSEDIDKGGFFTVGVTFTRFLGWMVLGIGLPSDTPDWFNTVFIGWESIITLLLIGFIISSVWNG